MRSLSKSGGTFVSPWMAAFGERGVSYVINKFYLTERMSSVSLRFLAEFSPSNTFLLLSFFFSDSNSDLGMAVETDPRVPC